MRKRDIAKIIAVVVMPGGIPLAIAYCLYKFVKGGKIKK